MIEIFVSKFVTEKPDEFERLKSLIRQKADLGSVILEFDWFLAANGFDQTYGSGNVFFAGSRITWRGSRPS